MEHLRGSTSVPEKRCKRDAFRAAGIADGEVAKEHAQWSNPALKPRVEASRSLGVGGVEAAISVWVADESNRVLGQELPEEEEVAHADLVRAEKEKALGARYVGG